MADLLQKNGNDSHSVWPFCAQELETANHILTLNCVFTRQIWLRVLSLFGWAALSPPHGSWLQSWWPSSRACFPEHLRDGFDSLVVLISWQLWKKWNSRVFDYVFFSVSVILEFILRAIYGR
ncbi:hypothetical protein [Oryza sativa Japonica Group]|uniref:Uncharacterized protein P0410E03.6 n=1 Tax=Oryza sativa subsp. japonica TaxID=39947 RepID=Q5ZE20_ORYSJ|nr:hypothetical protein [Oryza sativa Japonica Group]